MLFLDEEENSKETDIKGKLKESKKGMQKLEEKIKLQIFNVFCSLLKNFELSAWKIYILLTVELIQFLQFPFHPSLIVSWQDQYAIKYFSMAMQIFSIRFWIDYADISWEYFLILFYILILLVFLVIIDFLYCSFAVNNQKHAFAFLWPIHLLQYSCLLLMTILFQPILELFLSMLACQSLNSLNSASDTHSDTTTSSTTDSHSYATTTSSSSSSSSTSSTTSSKASSTAHLRLLASTPAATTTTKTTSTSSSSSTMIQSNMSLINSTNSTTAVLAQETANKTSALVLSMFTNIECFSSTHVMHAVFAIIIALILFILTLLIVFLMFESRKVQSNIYSKINSRIDVFLTILKFILVIVFSFLQDSSFEGFKSIILVIASGVSFLKFFFQRPYYNQRINDVLSVYYGIFAWSCIVLLISQIIAKSNFNMALIIYFLGLIIVITLVLTFKQKNINILLLPLHKHLKGEDSLSQFNILLQLIQTKDHKRDSSILIKGYVNFHEMTCTDNHCALKQYQLAMIKSSQINVRNHDAKDEVKGLLGGNQNSNSQKIIQNESNSLLLSHTKKLLERAIKKFPTCSILKVHYAHFLLDQLGNKREAMKELNECIKLKPPLDQQFMIVRYKKLIGDSLIEGGKEGGGGYEYISAMNFESNYRKCKYYIEKSALLHYEFWNHLLEESPDLGRLSDLGSKIDESLKLVEFHWAQMQLIFPNTPKALKLYASFMIEVLNDKEGGNELFLKAKEASSIKANFEMGGTNFEDISSGVVGGSQQDGSPLVYISGETDRLGYIQNLNLATCRVFGYQRKEELLNKNIKILQPYIYQVHHDEFIRAALLKQGEQFASNKERSVYGKHSSGFIFPLSLQIKYIQSFLHGKQYVATLKSEKKSINQSLAYLIIDKEGIIQDVSSSCIQLLDIDKVKMMKKRIKYDINVVLPDLLRNEMMPKYQSKQGEKITYYFPEIVEFNDKNKSNNNENSQIAGEEQKSDLTQSAEEENEQSVKQKKNDVSQYNQQLYEEDSSGKEDNFKGFADKKRNQQDILDEQQPECIIQKSANKYSIFHCNLIPIQFQTIQNGETQAYSLRLDLIDEYREPPKEVKVETNQSEHQKTEEDKQQEPAVLIHKDIREKSQKNQNKLIEKVVKMSKFQFSFNPIYKKFVRELQDDENVENMIDQYYLHVKKENQKRTEEQQKITVMGYLNSLKNRMEKQEENNNAAMNGDDFIKEEDEEFSSDSNSDDARYGKTFAENSKKSKSEEDMKKAENTLLFQDGKRIAQLLGKNYLSGYETADKLVEKIAEMQEILRRKADVGMGVRTYRLTEGELVLVEESAGNLLINKSTVQVEAETEESTEGEESKEEKIDDILKNTLKSRKAFQNTLNDKSAPTPVQNLQIIANFILFIQIALAIIECIAIRREFSGIGENFNMIQYSYGLVSELQFSAFNCRSMILYQGSNYSYSMTSKRVNQTYQDMKDSLTQLYFLQNQINLQKISVGTEHNNIINNKVVPMYFQQQSDSSSIKALNFSLTESLLQISSSLFSISNLQPNIFKENEDDLFYFMYNNFNDLLINLIKSSNYYVDELLSRTQWNEFKINQIILYCSIGCFCISIIALVPVVQIVNRKKRQYLDIFLEIDNSNLRKLTAKCEKFMNMLQDEGNEELDSNDDELEELARLESTSMDDEYLTSKRNKKKKAKNTMKNKTFFLLRFAVGMLIIEVYFLANFIVETKFVKKCQYLVLEMNLLAQVQPYYWLALNSQREMMKDFNRQIEHQQSYVMSNLFLLSIQNLNSELQQNHLQHEHYLPEAHLTKFDEVMLQDLCTDPNIQLQNKTSINCTTFISSSAQQGLHTVIVRYQENLRKTLQNYIHEMNSSHPNVSSILNSDEMEELYLIQKYFIRTEMDILVQTLQNAIQQEILSSLEKRLAAFAIFIVGLLLLFVVVWLPFINALTTEVHQTKRILLLIPIELLITMKAVANLFTKKSMKSKS